MATCKNCIHERVCYAIIESGLPYLDNDKLPAEAFCMTFKNKLDFVEVVCCRNCKYWNSGDCYRLELSRPDDFCSYGEREEQ